VEFLGFVSLLRKYDDFSKYDYNVLRDGTLSYRTFMKGINEGKVSIERLNAG
jgi:hypothetical protein